LDKILDDDDDDDDAVWPIAFRPVWLIVVAADA
jgi:hypothetical protein